MSAAWIGTYVVAASHNPDEDQYAWSAGYYGKKVLHADFARHGDDIWSDPGFDPESYWGRSMGTRWVYAVGLALPWAAAPQVPYSYADPSYQGDGTRLDPRSRTILRLIGAMCAALGAAMIALRFGWVGVLAVVAVLAIPHGAENFARAWAEGPLLLGFGLAAASWGRRWFPFAVGLASTAKLTAVGLWPLVLIKAAHGWPSRLAAFAAMLGVWVVLTPPSWFVFGPGLLLNLVDARVHEYSGGQADNGGIFFAPSRYFWPLVLASALVVGSLVRRRLPVTHFRSSSPESPGDRAEVPTM